MNRETREEIDRDLRSRTNPRKITREELALCSKSEYVGKFPTESDYDEVIREDCDVFVDGKKVLAFRKSLFPLLKDGREKQPDVWEFFRKASREVYGTQRGVVAGTEFTTRPEARLTKGQVAFFAQSCAGLLTTLEQARDVLNSSDELTTKTVKLKQVVKAFPKVKETLKEVDRELKRKDLQEEDRKDLISRKRKILWGWFDPWLENEWLPSENKVQTTKDAMDNFISIQLNFNHCYSNVLGAIDRGCRFPYGRLSGTTVKFYDSFSLYQPIYFAACEGFRQTFPLTWQSVRDVISRVSEPAYNLFGTAFTSITLNFNFRTAYHVDKNNLKGALAVLTALTRGNYEGHYLVFPELRLAFDLRDGDFIAGDTQTLLHGNTEMVKMSEDAERISLVFYSRENMIYLEKLECEDCRREFMRYSIENLPEKGKRHKEWRGVWPEMWVSTEWREFKRGKGLEHCSNSNWKLSSPYRNVTTKEVKLFRDPPGAGWEFLEVLPSQA